MSIREDFGRQVTELGSGLTPAPPSTVDMIGGISVGVILFVALAFLVTLWLLWMLLPFFVAGTNKRLDRLNANVEQMTARLSKIEVQATKTARILEEVHQVRFRVPPA